MRWGGGGEPKTRKEGLEVKIKFVRFPRRISGRKMYHSKEEDKQDIVRVHMESLEAVVEEERG